MYLLYGWRWRQRFFTHTPGYRHRSFFFFFCSSCTCTKTGLKPDSLKDLTVSTGTLVGNGWFTAHCFFRGIFSLTLSLSFSFIPSVLLYIYSLTWADIRKRSVNYINARWFLYIQGPISSCTREEEKRRRRRRRRSQQALEIS